MLYIIAANLGQARKFATDSGFEPCEWTYLHSTYQLRGIERPAVLRHTSARERDNIDELNQAIALAYPERRHETAITPADMLRLDLCVADGREHTTHVIH
jgi:hypothetical protein